MEGVGYLLTKAFYAEVEQNEVMQISVTAYHHSLYTWICELRNQVKRDIIDLPAKYTMRMAFIGSEHTLKKCIDDLEKWGIVEVLLRKTGQPIKARLSIAYLQKHCNSPIADVQLDCNSPAITVQTTKTIKTNKNNRNKISPEKSEAASFDTFWNMYGKKEDRKKCNVAWGKLSEADKLAILKHLPGYILAKPELKFRKNPLTYLNGQCWLDEPTTYAGQPASTLNSSHLNGSSIAPAPPTNRIRR